MVAEVVAVLAIGVDPPLKLKWYVTPAADVAGDH
jgi:hypothetical protein